MSDQQSDADRLVRIHRWIASLPKEQQTEAYRRASCSYSGERSALAWGAHVEGDDMVWPDGERYPRRTEPYPTR